jgi:lipoyl(octanoyl) transferase
LADPLLSEYRPIQDEALHHGAGAPEWMVASAPVEYPEAVAFMEDRVEKIRIGAAPELVWLLEHPPLYTAGTSAKPEELLVQGRFPVFASGRGGRYTYHGPGQRVAYVMLDLRRRGADIRAYVCALESWVIAVLKQLGVRGERRQGRVGIWIVQDTGKEAKIAAIGVRIRRWISYHGISINVSPDLNHFEGIVPCGIAEHGVTSLRALGQATSMDALDSVLQDTFGTIFGPAGRPLHADEASSWQRAIREGTKRDRG